MDKKSKNIQDIFGIFPPDVATEEDQTQELHNDTAKKLAEMVNFMGGKAPGQTVKDFLIRKGVAEEVWPEILKAAGVEIAGKEVRAAKASTQKFQAQRSEGCTVHTLKRLAAELAEKVKVAEGGISEDEIRAWFAGEIAPNKVTAKRWGRLVEFSGLVLDGCWFHSPDSNGYTADPEDLTGAEADRAEYEKKTGKKAPVPTPTPAPAPVTTAGAPAIANHLVVMVDAHFSRTPSNAFAFSVWVDPYIKAVEEREQKPFYILDADYGKGPKLLAGVISADLHQNPPGGLVTMNSSHPLAGVVLPLFERAGALIVYGRR